MGGNFFPHLFLLLLLVNGKFPLNRKSLFKSRKLFHLYIEEGGRGGGSGVGGAGEDQGFAYSGVRGTNGEDGVILSRGSGSGGERREKMAAVVMMMVNEVEGVGKHVACGRERGEEAAR